MVADRVTSAHEAWGDSGGEVARLLSNRFGMTLGEFSRIVRYWSIRCSLDPNLASRYAVDKVQRKQKYIGGSCVTMT